MTETAEVAASRTHRQFALQRAGHFGTVWHVRMIVALLALFTLVCPLIAQEQEGKLVDRLLRPNMSLANPAQDKQFATGSTSLDKGFPIRSFCVPEESPTKTTFGPTRVLSPQEFAVRHFRTGDSPSALNQRSQFTKTDPVEIVVAASPTRAALESGNNIATTSFTDNRPFSGQGKSQKALHAYDRPLTIEQVRELLNKNK